MKKKVIVLGAGLQGSCIALELANRGFNVELLDKDPIPVNRASLRNEGKIHLGLIYVNDQRYDTPVLMLKAALGFSDCLRRWIGDSARNINLSNPFYYVVSNDSFLNMDELEERYEPLNILYREMREKNPGLNYLGTKPDRLIQRCCNGLVEKYFTSDTLQGVFQTSELAIDPKKLSGHIKKAIKNHSNISFSGGYEVKAVSKKGSEYLIEGIHKDGTWSKRALQVVNATWAGKYTFDEMIGISAPEDILHRLKYRVVADVPAGMKNYPSATMVIGRFGDVVVWPDHKAYISWYPEACRGWSNSLKPPEAWNKPSRGEVPKEDFDEFSEKFIQETKKWYPAIKNCNPKIVDAGIIVARGRTDVHDKQSQLHERSGIGVTSYDGYHTVETGKLTTAPMFSMDTADHVDEFFKQL